MNDPQPSDSVTGNSLRVFLVSHGLRMVMWLCMVFLVLLLLSDLFALYRLARADQVNLQLVGAAPIVEEQALLSREAGPSDADLTLQTIADLAQLLERSLAGLPDNSAEVEMVAGLANHVDSLLESAADTPVEFDNLQQILQAHIVNLELPTADKTTHPEAHVVLAELRQQLEQLAAFESSPEQTSSAQLSTALDTSLAADRLSIAGAITDLQTSNAETQRRQKRVLATAAGCFFLFAGQQLARRRRLLLTIQKQTGSRRSEHCALQQLTDEVASMANGDLRVRATASFATTQVLAESCNRVVTNLSGLVRRMGEAGSLLIHVVERLQQSSRRLADGSVAQAREMHRSSNYLGALSGNMARLSASATEASRLIQTVGLAHGSTDALHDSEDWSGLGKQCQQDRQRLERFSTSCRGIAKRVDTLSKKANVTNLLAINARIDSNPGNFAETHREMADEVAQLALEVQIASAEIQQILRAMQQGVNAGTAASDQLADVFSRQDQASRQRGVKDVSRAAAADRLRALLLEVQEVATRQSGVVRNLTSNLGVINGLSDDAARQIEDNLQALTRVGAVVYQLQVSASDYTLPIAEVSKRATGSAAEPAKLTAARQLADRVWSGDAVDKKLNMNSARRKLDDAANVRNG